MAQEPHLDDASAGPTSQSATARLFAYLRRRADTAPPDRPSRELNGNGRPAIAQTAHLTPVPELPVPYLRRERLLQHLDTAIANPVVLVSAPAGWGKTALLASWIHNGRAPGPVVYFRFGAEHSMSDWDQLWRTLTDTPPVVGDPLVLVLDDFHRAVDDAVTQVQHLLAGAGDRLRVVLLTRTDPPLPLYRWRLSGRLAELRADRLSFTATETAGLLRAFGLDVSANACRRWHEITEGWPAALNLAASAMLGHPEPEADVEELRSRSFGAAEYLRAEVLGPLPADLLDAVLRTSIVERLCAGLVESLTWRSDAARILADLERTTGLIRHTGGTEPWYRPHQILRLVLQNDLRQQYPEQVAGLHRAASEWYAANGLPTDALEHALSGADWPRATDLLEQHWPEMLSGRGRHGATAFPPAPPEEIAANPLLALAFAVQRRDRGDLAGMRLYLHTAEAAAGLHPTGPLARILDAVRLVDAQSEGDVGTIMSTADRLTAPAADESGHSQDAVRALAMYATAAAKLATIDLDGVERAAFEAMTLARRAGATFTYLAALAHTALVGVGRGRLGQAAHSAQRVLAGARQAGLSRSPDISLARFVLATVCLERGQVDDAEYHLDLALAGDMAVDPFTVWAEPMVLARLRQLRGDPEHALELLQRTAGGLSGAPPPMAAAMLLIEAELQLAVGQPAVAWRLLQDSIVRGQAPFWSAIVESKVLLSGGRAAEVIERWRQVPDVEPSLPIAVEGYLVRARAAWDMGMTSRCWRLAERGLQLAEVEGIRRPFLVNAELLQDLLISHLSTGTRYGDRLVELIRAMGGPAAPTNDRSRGHPAESLTQRESVVLRYLDSTLSTAEIADVLNVSANTVKTHMKNVYRKLEVGRRRDAVRRGRELGLR